MEKKKKQDTAKPKKLKVNKKTVKDLDPRDLREVKGGVIGISGKPSFPCDRHC